MKHLLLILVFLTALYAHQSGLSYFEMTQINKLHINVVYKKPILDINVKDLIIQYPNSCHKISPIEKYIKNGFIIKKYSLLCQEKALFSHKIWIEGLVKLDRGVVLFYKNRDFKQQALFRASKPFVQLSKKSSYLSLAINYIHLGFTHIMKGYDHLMFVFLLVVLARSVKILLFAITAFTLSHSLTLASSVLGIIHLSVPFVEAMIALSIIFLAREFLLLKPNSLSRKHLAATAFVFGLLHGFGFSSVLGDIGLPKGEIPLALFSFNIGIELGQLLFVSIVYTILKGVDKYIKAYKFRLLQATVYLIGVYASYLFLQRSLPCCI